MNMSWGKDLLDEECLRDIQRIDALRILQVEEVMVEGRRRGAHTE